MEGVDIYIYSDGEDPVSKYIEPEVVVEEVPDLGGSRRR